ncbi:hypothetical protein [Gymnodinialimonas ulvae]|uniref:hypothetical protein n=1 Tax=Gymnodinialimonas ulvae TaxID=3126504 RepID=UPI0030A4E527
MLDGNEKSLLFIGILVAGFISLASQSLAPDDGGPVQLDIADLPALPAISSADLAGAAPLQLDLPAQTHRLTDDMQATLLYSYVLEGEVVSRRRFRGEQHNAVSPLDLGIVWGNFDTTGFEFTAGNRVLWSRPPRGAALPHDWDDHITNNHLLPATNAIRADLMAVEVGQRVRIEGYLVEVTGDRLSPWRSSTLRNDSSIGGGCEIILVRGVEILSDAAG